MSRITKWHDLDIEPSKAASTQKRLVKHLNFNSTNQTIQRVGGADVSYNQGSNLLSAAICIFDRYSLKLTHVSLARSKVDFPYISGMLAFRELPPLVAAWGKIPPSLTPHLMVFDGHGSVHPRSMGLASHAGLWFQVPSFGIAKKPLYGEYDLPERTKGAYKPILDPDKNIIGYVLRTRTDVKPVFVSAGYSINQAEARDWALQLSPSYRISKPIREAHKWANRLRTKKEKPGFSRA